MPMTRYTFISCSDNDKFISSKSLGGLCLQQIGLRSQACFRIQRDRFFSRRSISQSLCRKVQLTSSLQSDLNWRSTSRFDRIRNPILTLVGVYGFPKCPGANSTLCEYMSTLLDIGAYVPFVQEHLAQADYWHVCI